MGVETRERDEREAAADEDRGLSLGGRHILKASPLIWVLLAGAVVWAAWVTVTRGSSSSSSVRAVVVPTGGQDRMVVALSCSSIAEGSSTSKQAGSTSIALPAGSGLRVVLVPGCQSGGSSAGGAGSGGSGGSNPSGVVVMPPGTPAPKQGKSVPTASGSHAKVAAVFDAPSWARTIVVTPCPSKHGSSSSSSAAGTAVGSGHGLLVAPPCA